MPQGTPDDQRQYRHREAQGTSQDSLPYLPTGVLEEELSPACRRGAAYVTYILTILTQNDPASIQPWRGRFVYAAASNALRATGRGLAA